MDFGLEDHQVQLVRSARDWTERSWAAADVDDAAARRALTDEVVANGWTTLLDDDADGGEVIDAALLTEALAAGGCSLGLPSLVVGRLLGGVDGPAAMVESGASAVVRGADVAADIVIARSTPEEGPGGQRHWETAVVDAGAATRAAPDAPHLGLCSLAEDTLDRAAWSGTDDGIAERAWAVGAILSAAELVGLADRVLAICVEYAGQREQGGKPIGGHQAVQHRLADMVAAVDRSRYATYAAALAGPDAATAVHEAKALAARDGLGVMRSGHQVMGAISYSAEHVLPRLHKQATVAAHEFGSAGWHWQALERLGATTG